MRAKTPLTFLAFVVLSSLSSGSWGEDSDPFLAHSNEPHQVQVFSKGTASLEKKLELITNAQRTLDLEYYVFDPDQSGRLILQAILNRAKDPNRPVKIRILLDYNDAKKRGITPSIAQVLLNSGIQVKYFNQVSMINFPVYNHRDHRKLIVVDGTEFCAGGRNMADDYLDTGTARSRVDRDICVQGPLTSAAEKTFEEYWDSPLATPPASAFQGLFLEVGKAEQEVFGESQNDRELLYRVRQEGREMLRKAPVYTVHSIDFVSDRPILGDESRVVAAYVQRHLEGTNRKVMIENMLYLPTSEERDTINKLISQGKEVTVMSDLPVASASKTMSLLALRSEMALARRGANVYLESGEAHDGQNFLAHNQVPGEVIWGTHTKNIVRDDKDTSIGSFNFDPRSANINYEDEVVVYDSPELAAAVQKDMLSRSHQAHVLDRNGFCTDCAVNPEGKTTIARLKTWTLDSLLNLLRSEF